MQKSLNIHAPSNQKAKQTKKKSIESRLMIGVTQIPLVFCGSLCQDRGYNPFFFYFDINAFDVEQIWHWSRLAQITNHLGRFCIHF